MENWTPPTFMAKVTGFLVTWKDWASAGFPKRSPEWIRELFGICKACPEYDPEGKTPLGTVGICRICGCHVSDDPDTTLNKLLMPNTSCPLGKWQASIECKNDPPTNEEI